MFAERKRNWLNRFFLQVPATKAGAWFFSRTLRSFDKFFLRLTRGRTTLSTLLTNTPVIWVTTRGAKSGKPYTTPLIGTPRGHALILVASNFGSRRAPSWYYNLRAHGEAIIEIEGKRLELTAREIFGEEYDRLWKLAADYYPGYDQYRARAGRHIPLLLLESKE